MNLPPAFTVTTRRMTLLERWHARPSGGDSAFGALGLFFIVAYGIAGLAVAAFIVNIIALMFPRYAVWVWGAAGAAVLVLGYRLYRRRQAADKGDDAFAADRRAGVVEVHALPLAAAVRLTTDDEEAPGWPMLLVQCADGRRVFLEGDYLSGPAKEEGFPGQVLELIWLPRARRVLLARSQGAPVPATIMAVEHWRWTPGDYTEVMGTEAGLGEANRWLDAPHEAAVPPDAIDEGLPLHPLIRPLWRYHLAYLLIACFVGAIGILPPVFILKEMTGNGIGSDGVLWAGDIAMKVFNGVGVLVFPIFAFFLIRLILRGRAKMQATLRRASRLLETATPVRTGVTFTYHLQVSRGTGEDRSDVEKTYRVRLAGRVPHLPAEFEVLPPLGQFKPEIGRYDWKHTGKAGAFSQIFLQEEADVYAGTDSLAVIPTRKGVLIREMKTDG